MRTNGNARYRAFWVLHLAVLTGSCGQNPHVTGSDPTQPAPVVATPSSPIEHKGEQKGQQRSSATAAEGATPTLTLDIMRCDDPACEDHL